nr:serine/arginine repetitive matrix protein 3 [Oryctolagus cuniculus]
MLEVTGFEVVEEVRLQSITRRDFGQEHEPTKRRLESSRSKTEQPLRFIKNTKPSAASSITPEGGALSYYRAGDVGEQATFRVTGASWEGRTEGAPDSGLPASPGFPAAGAPGHRSRRGRCPPCPDPTRRSQRAGWGSWARTQARPRQPEEGRESCLLLDVGGPPSAPLACSRGPGARSRRGASSARSPGDRAALRGNAGRALPAPAVAQPVLTTRSDPQVAAAEGSVAGAGPEPRSAGRGSRGGRAAAAVAGKGGGGGGACRRRAAQNAAGRPRQQGLYHRRRRAGPRPFLPPPPRPAPPRLPAASFVCPAGRSVPAPGLRDAPLSVPVLPDAAPKGSAS